MWDQRPYSLKITSKFFLSPLHLHKLTIIQKRREQNRTSQQKFRERTRKEYEALEQALEAERQRAWNSLILTRPKTHFGAIQRLSF